MADSSFYSNILLVKMAEDRWSKIYKKLQINRTAQPNRVHAEWIRNTKVRRPSALERAVKNYLNDVYENYEEYEVQESQV